MEVTTTLVGPVEPAFASGRYDQVIVIVWRGAPVRAVLARSADALRACRAGLTGPVAYLAVVEETSGPPSPFDLRFISRTFDEIEDLVAIAAVLEGRGPWLARALDAAMQIRAGERRPCATKHCTDPAEAISWLIARRVHRAPERALRAGVLEVIDQLRRRLDDAGR